VITEKPVDETKLKKLEEKINLQKSELKKLTQEMMDEKESFDQQKIKFQTKIAMQNQEMSGLQKELEKAKSEIKKPVDTIKVAKRNENIEMLKQNFNKERDEFSKLLAEVKNELKITNDENDECTNKLLKTKEECERANSENTKLKDQISDYGSQISKLKKEINDKKLSDRMFQVERIKEGLIKNTKVMTITFSWNKSRNIIEVKFKRMKHGGKVKEDIINILDITKFEKNEKKPENIDVIFNVSNYIYNN
jgi:chromosome segregation ATPase